MVTKVLIDTNILIDLMNGVPEAKTELGLSAPQPSYLAVRSSRAIQQISTRIKCVSHTGWRTKRIEKATLQAGLPLT